MKPEEYFLKYNKDNIFKNLVQAEDHLKKVKEPNFAQCALKHTMFAEGEAEEAVGHSMSVEPESTEDFKELVEDVTKLRKEIQTGNFDPDKTVSDVRRIRRKFESFNKDYDVSRCRSCGEVIEKLKSTLKNAETAKALNKSNPLSSYSINRGEKRMVTSREIGIIAGSQFAGIAAKTGVDYVDKVTGKAGEVAWKRPSTLISIGAGVALPLIAMKYLRGDTALAATVIGTSMLASEIFSIIRERAGISGLAAYPYSPEYEYPYAGEVDHIPTEEIAHTELATVD